MDLRGLDREKKRLEILREELRDTFVQEKGIDPVSVMDRMVALQERCMKVQKKLKSLAALKQDLLSAMEHPVSGVDPIDQLGNLQISPNIIKALHPVQEARSQLEGILGKRISKKKLRESISSCDPSLTAAIDSGLDDLIDFDNESVASQKENISENFQPEEIKQAKPSQKYFIEEKLFLSLPDSVRGRAKLSEAQKTLSLVVAMHKKKAKRASIGKGRNAIYLSLKELDSNGAKVVGHTGSCILASLRSLGFITVSKEGVSLATSPTQ